MSDLSRIDAAELERRRAELVEREGPWRFFNFELRGGVYTMGPQARGLEWRVAPLIRLVEDLVGPVAGLRALDLGCMEGLFALELARRGAEAVGIEARAGHVARAEFARDALGLEGVAFRQGDVRELSGERDGEFDVVLALGILYHLDAPDAFEFARRLAEVCSRIAIIDTQYSLRAARSWEHGGHSYSGVTVREHDPSDTAADREASYGSSIDNPESIWLTRNSLYNLLHEVGFSSVLELRVPHMYPEVDRVHLVALKGAAEPLTAHSTAHLGPWSSPRWREDEQVRPSHQQTQRQALIRKLTPWIPAPIRRAVIRRRRARR